MTRIDRAIGLARSLATYHGIPFRQRRLRRLYRSFVNAGDLAFDIGAHAGNRVRALTALGCRVVEGTIMGGPCVRVDNEFLALVDFKGSGLVVKLPRHRVDDLVARGIGQPFAPAGRVFKEWVSIPARDRSLWRALLVEGIEFVSS